MKLIELKGIIDTETSRLKVPGIDFNLELYNEVYDEYKDRDVKEIYGDSEIIEGHYERHIVIVEII